MSRAIFGFPAGVSALFAYRWYTNRKCDADFSISIDKLNRSSSAVTSLPNITEKPSPSGNVLNENLAQELALLREEVLKLKSEKDEATLETQRLSDQLLEEALISKDLRTKNEHLLLEVNFDHQIYDHELEILRTSHHDAMSAMQHDFYQQISALKSHSISLQDQILMFDSDLINVAGERNAAVFRNVASQTENEEADLHPPPVQEPAPQPERTAEKPEVPVFACSDFRYKGKKVEGYSVIPGEQPPNVSTKQDPVPPMPTPPPSTEQENLPRTQSCDFRIIHAVGEREFPESYQLTSIGAQCYGQIIGKGGKNVKEFEEVYGVKVSVLPPSGPHPQVRVLIAKGNSEGRRTVAKKIIESLPVSVEVPLASLGCLSSRRKQELWAKYFVDIKNALNEKWILRGKLSNCVRLFHEQKISKA